MNAFGRSMPRKVTVVTTVWRIAFNRIEIGVMVTDSGRFVYLLPERDKADCNRACRYSEQERDDLCTELELFCGLVDLRLPAAGLHAVRGGRRPHLRDPVRPSFADTRDRAGLPEAFWFSDPVRLWFARQEPPLRRFAGGGRHFFRFIEYHPIGSGVVHLQSGAFEFRTIKTAASLCFTRRVWRLSRRQRRLCGSTR